MDVHAHLLEVVTKAIKENKPAKRPEAIADAVEDALAEILSAADLVLYVADPRYAANGTEETDAGVIIATRNGDPISYTFPAGTIAAVE